MTRITTKRLILRSFELSDAPRVTELISNPDIISMLQQPPWPYTLDDAKLWISSHASRRRQKQAYNFAITLEKEGLIGSIGLEQKQSKDLGLGYWIGEPFWGKGYAGEAAAAILQWAKDELAVTKLTSGYFADNLASGRILTKLGFTLSGKACLINNPLRREPISCLDMVWNKDCC